MIAPPVALKTRRFNETPFDVEQGDHLILVIS